MNYRSLWVLLVAFMIGLSPFATTISGSAFAEEAASDDELMTEAQLADVLVNVLGLASFLPPNPQEVDRFAILLQNEIVPANGWNPTNYVTMGTLARVLVQSMRLQSEIENPDDDASWVEYLKSIGVEFATVQDGLEQASTISAPVALAAIDPSTDPLRKIPNIRPSDEQQLGADLQPFSSQVTAADLQLRYDDVLGIIVSTKPPEPPEPEPTTPN